MFEDEFIAFENANDEYVPAITQFITCELDVLMGDEESSDNSEDETDEFKLNYYQANKLKKQVSQHKL